MLIKKPADIRPSEITSKDNYLNRRNFIQSGAIAGGSILAGQSLAALVPTERRAKLADVGKSAFSTDEVINSYEDITTYNNYYEFGTQKDDPYLNSQKFEPPIQGFSNIHIDPFDSIMGVIAGWWDRQTQEIANKLLTFPTFTVYAPDFKSLFSLDLERTEKQWEIFLKQFSGDKAGSFSSIEAASKAPTEARREIEGSIVIKQIRQGLEEVSKGKALKMLDAVAKESQTRPPE